MWFANLSGSEAGDSMSMRRLKEITPKLPKVPSLRDIVTREDLEYQISSSVS